LIKKILSALLLFLSIQLTAQKKAVSSFTLDIERHATIANQPESVTNTKIAYRAFPLEFMYTSPQQQYAFCKEKECWIYNSDSQTFESFPEAYDLLMQTAKDLLNWFKSDFDLSATGYIVASTTMNNDSCISIWKHSSTDANPIAKVKAFSDKDNHFTKLQMYKVDGTLFAETKLLDYQYQNGIYFPTTIQTKSYDDKVGTILIVLELSNVKLNTYEHLFSTGHISKETNLSIFPAEKKENFIDSATGEIPTADKSDSLLGICVYGAYLFYKKFITAQDMSNCSFSPSCSQYMLQAVQKNGLFGLVQGYERLTRCTIYEHQRDIYPQTKDGKQYDPVP